MPPSFANPPRFIVGATLHFIRSDALPEGLARHPVLHLLVRGSPRKIVEYLWPAPGNDFTCAPTLPSPPPWHPLPEMKGRPTLQPSIASQLLLLMALSGGENSARFLISAGLKLS